MLRSLVPDPLLMAMDSTLTRLNEEGDKEHHLTNPTIVDAVSNGEVLENVRVLDGDGEEDDADRHPVGVRHVLGQVLPL